MKRCIFHGSNQIISRPEYGRGSTANDYGRGFYCTESIELAREWACARNADGYVNRYEFDMDGLRVLNLNDGQYHILNWLALLTRYRSYWQKKSIAEEAKNYLQKQFLPDISGYDVIVGYRADDSYFSFAQDFVMGAISLRQLEQAMHLGKLGEQIVLKSERAFTRLLFMGYEEVLAEEYYLKKVQRDKQARAQYRRTQADSAYAADLFIIDILREGIANDDPRLR